MTDLDDQLDSVVLVHRDDVCDPVYGSDEGGHVAVGPHHKSCDSEDCDHAPDGICSDIERAERDAAGMTALVNASPVLLEIAAAAKALQSEGWDFRSSTMDVLLAALDKVTS